MKALVIEDDSILSDTICQIVSPYFSTEQALDGEEGVLFAKQDIYDVIILDLMMPGMNGYEVLAQLRKEKIMTPVIILTAKDEVGDKVKGLSLGADDYLVKPFEREELLARLQAIIRRATGNYNENTVSFEGLILNLQNRKATIDENEISLQGKQFDMLEYLINHNNTILTKEQIFDKIWGFDSETTTNVVEVYASALRKELKKYNYDKYLKTIRNVGYIWSK